jgi:PAS domain S-box-containing protein
MIWSIDTEGRFTFVNQAVKQLHGYEPEELLGRKFSEFTTPEQAQKEWEVFERVLAGECFIQHEAEYLHKDGTPFYVSINAIALRDDAGNVLGTTGTILDITNLKRTEAALRQSEAKLSTILNSAIAVIANFRLFANREWEYDYYSSGAEALYGYTPEELMTDKTLWMSRVFPEDLEAVILPGFEDIFAERPIRVEYRFWHKDGTLRWFSASVFSQRDEVADCWVVTTVDSDISDAKAAATLRKQAEEQLKLSLQEKEALLKEVHHRVKNNLQVISSLLDLQASHIQEPQTLEAFQIIQNRVKSISLVHKKLYRSKSLAQVNLADYIDNLTTHLIQTYTLNSDDITLQLRLDEVLCNLDTAIPCGLLINELVSNALKHGFPGNSRGSIWVELNTVGVVSPQNAQQVRLIVGNDGLKFPELSNLSEAESVGFQLIQALIQQIHGQMEIDESRGTEFKITFVNLGT